MKAQVHNLNEKKIWEFTPADTIYIAKKNSLGNNIFYYCQFVRLVHNTVYGTVLDCDSDFRHRDHENGKTIYATIKNCSLYGQGENETNPHFHSFTPAGYAYKNKDEVITEYETDHPSYAVVGLSRRSGSLSPLFGSNIQHQHTITLTIKRASLKRHLNNDWIGANEQLIEIEMSGSQYAELISSFNMGDGVPCTLRQFDKHLYPDPPYENPIDKFQSEFAGKMENLGKECASVIEDAVKMLTDKPTLNKGDREFLLASMNRLIQEVRSNIPFTSQQFAESMEKTVSQAKNEIETFVTNRIQSLGLEAAQGNPLLFLGTNIENESKK